jgi:hypothetical protein
LNDKQNFLISSFQLPVQFFWIFSIFLGVKRYIFLNHVTVLWFALSRAFAQFSPKWGGYPNLSFSVYIYHWSSTLGGEKQAFKTP